MSSNYVLAVLILIPCLLFAASPTAVMADMPENPINSGNLQVVNRNNPLHPTFKPDNLAEYKGVKLQNNACTAFTHMLEAMNKDGISNLRLQSAYRPYSYQKAIFEQRVKELVKKGHSKEEATTITSASIQHPGASEHQTGLALDVSIDGKLSQAFADTAAGLWLAENCHKFGFIIRYPKYKTEVTCIIYEPWHLRYVGLPHAEVMKSMDLTLEEYWCYLKQAQVHYIPGEEGRDYFLLLYSSNLPTEMPHGTVSISANNTKADAQYIITARKTHPPLW